MEHSYFHRLSRLLWGAIVALVVVLAVYVSFGRLLMSNVEQYGAQILRELNFRLPFTVEAERVRGEWHFFSPELVLDGLTLTIPASSEPPYRLKEGRVTLDVLDLIRTRSLQVSRLVLDGLSLRGELGEDGKFSIVGFGSSNRDISAWVEEFLLNIESVDLANNGLTLVLPDGARRELQLDLGMRRQGSSRVLEANIRSQTTGTEIALVAEGVGNPLDADTFDGELFLDIQMADLSAFRQMLNAPGWVNLEGELQARVWVDWQEGEPSLAVALDGQHLVYSAEDQSWQFPADRISLQASLVERRDHWTAFVSELDFAKGDIRMFLPRLQLDIQGDSLRVRTENASLSSVNDLLVDMSLTPTAIADVFEVLNTRGELSSMQLQIADSGQPGKDWQLSANFRQLEVDSWRGAPGVSSARGYVELSQAGGYVILDSQNFAMNFPTVYANPLVYEEFYGTINIAWDADDFTLSSGLLAARGAEGLANVMFGLNVPLRHNDVGLEMDLLVGLENFDPKYREKYLPYILNENLLAWLKPSIGEGNIEQGAFLWRGNLRRNTPELKTIQLFFNVDDLNLNYHPDWPPVTGVDAIVLIDDTNVSVWADGGYLYQSAIDYLSAEAWKDDAGRMMLAIAGALEGDAADGLRVVNNSPINEMVGSAFSDWQASGQLQTNLKLQTVLTGQPQPPAIDVHTRWRDVDLRIAPGNLPLTGVNGQFSYNSETGFHSDNLGGQIWGQDFSVVLGRSDSSAVDVDIATHVLMTDIQRWLGLDMLAFASGHTPAAIKVQVVPEEGTTLAISSELRGVTLDLPEPWAKSAGDSMAFEARLPLGGASNELEIELNSTLQLHLDLSEGRFTGGALAFFEPPAEVAPGVLRISGHTPEIDVAQWQHFIDTYIGDEFLASLDEQGGLAVEVDELGVETLLVMGQDIHDVILGVNNTSGTREVLFETDWLSARYLVGTAEIPSIVDVAYLDLDYLETLQLPSQTAGEPFGLPAMTVTLKGLQLAGKPVGQLDFTLREAGETLFIESVVGSFAGLNITEEKPASLQWRRTPGAERTSVEALLKFANLSDTLDSLGYQQILETRKGSFDLALEWPAAPQEFSLSSAEGQLIIRAKDGTFLSAPEGASGALRVLNILNLAEIIRRLSLTHMFESGIPFHSVDGEVVLQSGKIEVANLEVDGSASGFQFSGVADVASETLEGNLAVTLPVANNLPWIVALTAGLPVAAGVFVVSKVFEKQVNRFSSGVYSVSGPWDDPQLKFVRIFDDSSGGDKTTGGGGEAAEPPPVDPNLPGEVSASGEGAPRPEGDPNSPVEQPVPDPNEAQGVTTGAGEASQASSK